MTDASKPSPKPIAIFERTEKKYVITRRQFDLLMQAIGDKLRDDQYARSTISSLYFDTMEDTLINRSMEKPFYKEKLRIRSYGPAAASDLVFVELKKKFDGIVYKRRVQLPRDLAIAYMQGDVSYREAVRVAASFGALDAEEALSPSKLQTVREIDATIARYPKLRPRIMVVVNRLSLKSIDGSNIRFTFGFNARWRHQNLTFDQGEGGHLIYGEDERNIILEIKCQKAYPLWLVRALSNLRMYPQPCSKIAGAYTALVPVAQVGGKRVPIYQKQPLERIQTKDRYGAPVARRVKGAHCA
ncbi:polyphosphate polymerase domain-containing protein [Denitrobacterium detoxificans]|uniref:VTC domain-containing protein n=1 Tax=Denitrobacterium detoxificans TaxID=79604 RepID=A0A1H8QC52_9ACTN|nr:polyphosphate polymerase domain-containing protein [Denitrobacterium detoxificans]SEO51504.1 VTC domain-containing protein [Denitrobacterium detoxificans]